MTRQWPILTVMRDRSQRDHVPVASCVACGMVVALSVQQFFLHTVMPEFFLKWDSRKCRKRTTFQGKGMCLFCLTTITILKDTLQSMMASSGCRTSDKAICYAPRRTGQSGNTRYSESRTDGIGNTSGQLLLIGLDG